MSESLPISIVMPVYNGEKFLREAIDSILGQTFSDFEFIIVDDGSTDNSRDVIRSYTDPRIRMVENKRNLGVSASRNKGMKMSRGKYIAMMDADDISLPKRFAKQYDFMETNPKIDVCGTQREDFGNRTKKFVVLNRHEEIVTNFLFSCKINQPSVFMRKDIMHSLEGLYNTEYRLTEDYELWIRLFLNGAKFANLDETLIRYRWHGSNVSVAFANEQRLEASEARKKLLEQLNIKDVDVKTQLHETLKSGKNLDQDTIERVYGWVGELLEANHKTGLFPEEVLKKRLARCWFRIHDASTYRGLVVWRSFFRHPVPGGTKQPGVFRKAKFLAKCLLRHQPPTPKQIPS